MIARPDHLIVRPNLGAVATVDPLSEVLRSVRLTGGVFLAAQFTAPWSVSVKITPDDCAPFIGKPAQVIGYHVVIEGRLLLALEGAPTIEVRAGEIVLFPRNDAHTLASAPGIKPVSARYLIQPSPDGGLPRISHGGGGAATRIVCGFLASEELYNPLMSTLPRALKIDVRQGASRVDRGVFERARQPGIRCSSGRSQRPICRGVSSCIRCSQSHRLHTCRVDTRLCNEFFDLSERTQAQPGA